MFPSIYSKNVEGEHAMKRKKKVDIRRDLAMWQALFGKKKVKLSIKW